MYLEFFVLTPLFDLIGKDWILVIGGFSQPPKIEDIYGFYRFHVGKPPKFNSKRAWKMVVGRQAFPIAAR